MSRNYEIIRGTIILAVTVLLVVFVLVRWIKRTHDDPVVLILKWIVTIPVLVLMFLSLPLFSVAAPFVIVFCAVILSVLWTPNIGRLLARPLTSMFDGGDVEPEARPAYSIARAKRNRGEYAAAIAEVHKQLDRFPDDLEGHLLLAAIHAENFHDLEGASAILNRFANDPKRTDRQVAAAMNQLADWYLCFGKDVEAARKALETIRARFPDSECALMAAQRIAHLSSPEHLQTAHSQEPIPVPHTVEYFGLEKDTSRFKPPEPDWLKIVEDYVRHLEEHPLDMEAREKLAVIYAEQFGRLDLATDQLQQLMQLRHDSPQHVAHWLNLLADLQIKAGLDYDIVRTTLQTIGDLFPGSTVAENAQRRIDRLQLEFKAKEKSRTVQLGSYEKWPGLKMRS